MPAAKANAALKQVNKNKCMPEMAARLKTVLEDRSLSLSLSVCLSVSLCLSLSLFVCLSLSVSLPACLSVWCREDQLKQKKNQIL